MKMKITKKLIEHMIREAVKQYAGYYHPSKDKEGEEEEFGFAIGSEDYEKLKNLASMDGSMAMELGYTPEIKGEEIVFSGDPIMDWIVNNYLNQPEKRYNIGITNTIIDFYLKVKDVLMRPRPGDPFGKDFNKFDLGVNKPILDMYVEMEEQGATPEEILKKMATIIAKHKKEQSKEYNDTLTSIFKGDSE